MQILKTLLQKLPSNILRQNREKIAAIANAYQQEINSSNAYLNQKK